MHEQHNIGQALLDFLLASPEGRAALSAILTAFIGSVIRLAVMYSERRITNHEDILRLEQQDALEQQVEVIKRQVAELSDFLEEMEEG